MSLQSGPAQDAVLTDSTRQPSNQTQKLKRQNMMYIESQEKRGAISRRAVLKGGALAAMAVACDRVGWASANEQPSIPQVRLGNGVMMPMLGFGTYSLRGE